MKILPACVLLLLTTTVATAQDDPKTLAERLKNFDGATFAAAKEPDGFYRFLKAKRDEINQRNVASWRKVQTRNDWENFIGGRSSTVRLNQIPEHLFPTVARGAFGALHQNLPFQKETRVHVTKTLKGDGFTVENLLYESRHFFPRGDDKPCLWVAANLYCPDPVPQSAPAFVIIHSHHNPKTQGELQDMGMTWARQGCYVLVPEMLGHGERRDHPFNTEKDYAGEFKVGRQDYYFRYNLGMQLHHINEHLIGWMACDVMVGVDVLLTKPAIDRKRIILLGSVAGGGDPAALVAAMDPRIAAVAPFNFGRASFEKRDPPLADAELSYNYVGGGSWETTRNIMNSGSNGYLPWVLVSAVAPRGLIYAHEFAWDESDPVWKRYQKIYSLYGADDKLAVIHGRGSVQGKAPESTHCNNIGPEHRKPIYPILKKWFNIPIPEKEYTTRFKAEDLQCWTPEWRDKLKPLKAHELMAKIADFYNDAEESVTAPIGYTAPFRTKPKGRIVKTDAKSIPGFTATWHEWDVYSTGSRDQETSLKTYGLRLTPADLKDATTGPVVVAIARRGKQAFLQQRSDTIAELLKRNIQVLLVDLPGTGELGPGSNVGRTSSQTTLASLAELTGMDVQRYQELALAKVVADAVMDVSNNKRVPMALWCDSFAPPNAINADVRVPLDAEKLPTIGEPMCAKLLSCRPGFKGIYVRGGVGSYRTILDSPFVYLPYDAVPLNGCRFDLPRTVQRMFANYRLEAMIDAQNRVMSTATLEKLLPNANQRVENPRLLPVPLQVSAEPSAPVALATWFEEVLAK